MPWPRPRRPRPQARPGPVRSGAASPPSLPAGVAEQDTPLLTVSGLSVSYGPVRALDDVNLSVRTGELVALAGENGAGKTTLVRCIAGDVTPGERRDVPRRQARAGRPAGAAKHGIAVVWQDLALCDNLDVAANIMLGRERRG